MNQFEGRMAVQQRVLPGYRAPFFDLLALRCTDGLSLAAGEPLPAEGIPPADPHVSARLTLLRNRHFFHPRHSLYACFQSGLIGWLERENPDVLIVEANPRYLSTRAAVRWMKAHGRPVLGWGLGAPQLQGRLDGFRERSRQKLLATLDGIIAYSARGAGEYASLGVLPPGRIFTAFNAVAPPPDGPEPDRGPRARQARLLFVGRLQERKRVDLLLQACAAQPEQLRPALAIVGDGPARPALEALAARIFPEAVFTGALHGSELVEQFAAADLFVLPGTGGLAIQEAMSHALPVIVAEGDGTQADLVRPANGWLVPPDDLHTLSGAITNALADPDLRAKGLESRRIVLEEINLHRMVDVFIEAANSVKGGT